MLRRPSCLVSACVDLIFCVLRSVRRREMDVSSGSARQGAMPLGVARVRSLGGRGVWQPHPQTVQ
jgi:hypothetical protein